MAGLGEIMKGVGKQAAKGAKELDKGKTKDKTKE